MTHNITSEEIEIVARAIYEYLWIKGNDFDNETTNNLEHFNNAAKAAILAYKSLQADHIADAGKMVKQPPTEHRSEAVGMGCGEVGEKIVAAACRFGDIIACGARHYDMVMHSQLQAIYGNKSYPATNRDEQGFINQSGEFKTREEAYIIAKEAGQLQGRVKTGSSDSEVLYSEDLW